VPQKRPAARDVEASPSLKRDLLSFGSAFGEPVTASHVAPTWPLGWTVGSIGGDALRAILTMSIIVIIWTTRPHVCNLAPYAETIADRPILADPNKNTSTHVFSNIFDNSALISHLSRYVSQQVGE